MRRSTWGAVPGAVAVLVLLAGGAAVAAPLGLHDHPAPTPAANPHAGHDGHAGHGASQMPMPTEPPGGVSSDTRLAVLGGFGAVNAAAIGTAMVLRRTGRGRRTATR